MEHSSVFVFGSNKVGRHYELPESQYLAGEREAEIAALRNDPEYNQDQDDEATVERIAAQRLAAAGGRCGCSRQRRSSLDKTWSDHTRSC